MKAINIALIIFLSFFTIFHFTIIFLHAGPLNPVKVESRNFVEGYIDPLLRQNWQLFAPDPINVTSQVLIQYKTKEGKISKWYNVSESLTDASRKYPISGYNSASRIPTGIYHAIFSKGELFEEYERSVDKETFDENINVEAIKKSKEKQVDLLYRFASSSIPLITNKEVEKVNARIVNLHPVPFSKRFDKNYEQESNYIDFGWRKYIHTLSFS